jgi:hypothetical protein
MTDQEFALIEKLTKTVQNLVNDGVCRWEDARELRELLDGVRAERRTGVGDGP